MKKYLLSIIILSIAAVISLTLILTQPVLPSVYHTFNHPDTELLKCEEKAPTTLTKAIGNVQLLMTDLIEQGETYTDEQDLTNQFKDLESRVNILETTLSTVKTCNVESADVAEKNFSKLDDSAQTLVKQLTDERIAYLEKREALITEAQNFLSETNDFEKLYYTEATKDAIKYFSSLLVKLDNLSTLNNDYAKSFETYMTTKEDLYELAAQK